MGRSSLFVSIICGILTFATHVRASNVTNFTNTCVGSYGSDVFCMNTYISNLANPYKRNVSLDIANLDGLKNVSVPMDPIWLEVAPARFLHWDEERGSQILGDNPAFEIMFEVENVGHEAPVFVKDTNELYFSRLQAGFLSQMVVNLTADPPTLSEKVADPPLYLGAGARYRNGLIYCAVCGGNGDNYLPGIYTLDPVTSKSQVLVNSYFGYYFNNVDDLDIDNEGNIWFTDNWLGRSAGLNTMAPQMQAATYRYNPTTGYVQIVDDTIVAPNGFAFSPDRKTAYITDTGAAVAVIDPTLADVPGLTYNSTGKKNVYRFDVSDNGLFLQNRSPIYVAMEWVPDGIKVAANGYILLGSGYGVDVTDSNGIPLLRIQTGFLAVNVEFAGPNLDELWIVGHGSVARVKWNLTGPVF